MISIDKPKSRVRLILIPVFFFLIFTACYSGSIQLVIQGQMPDNPVNVGENIFVRIDTKDAGPVEPPSIEEFINEGGEVKVVDANTGEEIPGLTYSCGRLQGCELTFSNPGTYTVKMIVTISPPMEGVKTYESGAHTIVVVNPNAADTTLEFHGYTWDVDKGPIAKGDRVGFWLTLTNDGSAPAPTGLVTISDGTNSCVTGAKPISGSGSTDIGCFLQMMNAGANTITATYPGDENNNPSSATMTLDIEDSEVGNTLLTFEGYSWDTSQGLLAVNMNVGPVLKLWFAEGLPEATGKINVRGESVDNECEITLPSETMSCGLYIERTGDNLISAEYLGDENHDFATASMTITAGLYDPFFTLTTSPNPSKAGDEVVVSVELSGPSSNELPSGTVEITIPDPAGPEFDPFTCTIGLERDDTDSAMIGSCTWLPNVASDFTVNAEYAGDFQFNPASASITHSVEIRDSVVSFDSISPRGLAIIGQTVTFNVSVSGDGPDAPSREVEVSGAGGSCTAELDTNGAGSCSFRVTSPGQFDITALYVGDWMYRSSSTTESYGVFAPTETPDIGDDDGDGVPNYLDECPDEGNKGDIDSKGCPLT